MSSLPRAHAGRAASACTRPSTVWRCATAGFDGFRVLLFQQSGGLSQSDAEAGLEMNLDFFLGILNALNCGDVLNEVAYAVRPYEVNAGETDQKLDEMMDYMHEVFRKKQPWKMGDNLDEIPGRLQGYRGIYRQVREPIEGRRLYPRAAPLPRQCSTRSKSTGCA